MVVNIEDYLKVFDQFSYRNKLYGHATLHLITGRLLQRNERKLSFGMRSIDPRTSIIFLKPTFSGGSSGYGFVNKVCEGLGITIKSLDDVTDAGLIGTIKKKEDLETGIVDFEAVNGLLCEDGPDILYFDEASVLFMKNPPQYQAKLRNLIQKALNPHGDPTSAITKRMAYGEIKQYPHQSLYLVSFFPETIDATIVKTGFLQRPLTIPKFHNLNDRLENMYRDIDVFGSMSDKTELQTLIDSFKDTEKFIKENETFGIDDAIRPVMKGYVSDMVESIRNTSTVLQEDSGSFVQAYVRHMQQLSWHHAVLRESPVIEVADVKYAYRQILKDLFRDIVYWLENKSEVKKEVREEISSDSALKALFDKMIKQNPQEGSLQGYVGLTEFREAIRKEFRRSPQTAYRWINNLKNKNSIEEIKIGNSSFIKMR